MGDTWVTYILFMLNFLEIYIKTREIDISLSAVLIFLKIPRMMPSVGMIQPSNILDWMTHKS